MNTSDFKLFSKRIYFTLLLLFSLVVIGVGGFLIILKHPTLIRKKANEDTYISKELINLNDIENGIHISTGFKEGKGLEQVIISCTPCHSAKLVTQNRATKEGWIGIIRWMQETQNLWDLGANETLIVNYLSTYYAPEHKGRRSHLNQIEWYELKEN